MLARLWWKDARQFGPAWVAIAVMALVGFLLAGRYMPSEAGIDSSIWGFAILFSGLYALAIATAALAGERENGTLRLLDTMPVPRARLWDGKASFAVVTSLALTLVLLGIAATQVSDVAFDRLGGPGAKFGALVLVLALVLEAIGWGLFWSALLPNVLAAAVLAACSLLLLLPTLAPRLGESTPTILMPDSAPIRLGIALVTAGLSRVIFLASAPPLRSRFDPSKSVRSDHQKKSSVEIQRDRLSSGPSWSRTLASLAWQASREARSAWPYLALLGLGVPVMAWLTSEAYFGPEPLGIAMVLNPVVALLAGVGVFQAEQRGRSFRLLTHHGVRPAMVWPIKVAVWWVGLLVIWLPFAVFLIVSGGQDFFGTIQGTTIYTVLLASCFAVGLLCGMAIRRGITAALIGVMLVVALAAPIGVLITLQLLNPWWTLALPLAFLAVSWTWTGPWMLDRPGASRWLRLLGGLVLFVGSLFPLYLGLRAWSIPDPGPLPLDLRSQLTVAQASEDDDAGALYREFDDLISKVQSDRAMAVGMGRPMILSAEEAERVPDSQTWIEAHAEAIDLARRASSQPFIRFGSLEDQTMFGGELEDVPVWLVDRFLGVVVDRRRKVGDLEGAWEDLLTLFRMSRQPFEPRTARIALFHLHIEEETLRRAMNWAMDQRQTAGQLRNALRSFQLLKPPTDPLLVIGTEQVIAEQTLDLPRETLSAELARINAPSRSESHITPGTAAWASAISTPWEIERARRVVRTVFQNWRYGLDHGTFRSVIYEPYRRQWADRLLQLSPLAGQLDIALDGFFDSNDRAEVDRRALVQILALRAWQLEHDGQWPDRLQDLVPSVLDRLPDDPYKPGQPFGYVRSSTDDSQLIGSLNRVLGTPPGTSMRGIPVVLLYSIGPDAIDQRGAVVLPRHQVGAGDIVYPLPDDQSRPPKPDGPILELSVPE